MAYEVTATRRRPQNFESLIGQEFVAETLKNTIQSNKIAHAYLFSGPRGCGKTSTARIMAKALNCHRGPTVQPCGECPACKEITAGSCLDVLEIDGASNTSVNDVRQIKDEVMFPPNSCRYKIYIIDEVHMLSTSAFNALLKTIEEPPAYCIFIFATTELQKVPATIKSRCQQFNFRLVPIEKVKEQLSLAAQELGMKADDEALYWIAKESTGSMRDSYTLFDQVAAFSDGEITYDKIRDKLGLVGVDRLNELFSLCVKGDSENALLRLDDYLQNGVSIEQLVSNCTDYLRSILLLKSGVQKEALLGQSADRYSKEVLSSWSSIQVERALSIFMQLYRDIRYSLSPRYEFELAVSRLCWLKEYVSPAEVKRAIDAAKPALQSAVSARTISAVSNPQAVEGEKKNDTVISGNIGNPQQKGPAPVELTKAEIPSVVPATKPVNSALPVFSALQNATPEELEQEPSPDDYGGYEPPAPDYSSEYFMEEHKQPTPEETDARRQEIAANYEDEPQPSAPKAFEPVDTSNVDLSDLMNVKEAMISDFFVTDTMAAGFLQDSEEWSMNGDTITIGCTNPFQVNQLQAKSPNIAEYLSKLYKKPISFEVKLIKKAETQVAVDLPPEITMLRDIFKGSILGYDK